MSFHKPADPWKKVHIAAVAAAFAAVATPTFKPLYHWFFPQEKQIAVNGKATETRLPSLQQQ